MSRDVREKIEEIKFNQAVKIEPRSALRRCK